MDEDLKFLKELQKELKTQEVDGQAAPRYWVVMDYEWKVTANGYHDRVSVYDPNEGEAYEIKEYAIGIYDAQSDHYAEEALDELGEIIASYYNRESDLIEWIEDNVPDVVIVFAKEVAVIKPNTMFLTKQEALDHISVNHYHYSDKAHTYAMTAWRAPKVERLLKILETFDWDEVQEKG